MTPHRRRQDDLRGQSRSGTIALGIITWLVAALFFFPVFWMVLNSFKKELVANTKPVLFFDPTLDRCAGGDGVDPGPAQRSARPSTTPSSIVIVSTLLVLVLAIPAAYALAIYPIKSWRDVLFFFISTKFLPVVAAILPLWIIAQRAGICSTPTWCSSSCTRR